ncbi:hypothetical protein ACFQ0Q_43940 [Streptomyces aureus]
MTPLCTARRGCTWYWESHPVSANPCRSGDYHNLLRPSQVYSGQGGRAALHELARAERL